MANEITIQYALPDPMPQARESWKQNPPAWLTNSKGKYELVDETYNGLVYRGSSAYTRLGRMFSSSTYTLSLVFSAEDRSGTKVLITGQAPPEMVAAIRADAERHGGGTDPRIPMGVQLPR